MKRIDRRWALPAAGLIAALVIPGSPVHAQAPAPPPGGPGFRGPAPHRLVVTGRGVVAAVPDRIALVLVAVGTGGTQSAAQQQRDAGAQRIVRDITNAGVAPAAVQTMRFAGPRRGVGPSAPGRAPGPAAPAAPGAAGYVAIARLAVTVNGPGIASRIVAAAAADGGRVLRVRAGLQDPSSYHTQALRLAVQHAQADAAAMASAAGVPAPQLLQIEELPSGPGSFRGGFGRRGRREARPGLPGNGPGMAPGGAFGPRGGAGLGPGGRGFGTGARRFRPGMRPGGATVPQTVPVATAVRAVYTF